MPYSLPNISDPDGDKWKVNVDLGATVLFVTFARNSFNINPSNDS